MSDRTGSRSTSRKAASKGSNTNNNSKSTTVVSKKRKSSSKTEDPEPSTHAHSKANEPKLLVKKDESKNELVDTKENVSASSNKKSKSGKESISVQLEYCRS